MSTKIPTNLTEAQADGRACVYCNRDYVRSPGVHAVPLEVDGELLRGPSGSQLFVCANTCERDVQAADRVTDSVTPEPLVDAEATEEGPRSMNTPEEPAVGSYWDGHADGVRYAEQAPERSDVPDDAHTLRALLGPPTVDELVKVAAWAGISTCELVELRDGQPADREELRQISRWVDEIRINVERLAEHAGVEYRPLGGGSR